MLVERIPKFVDVTSERLVSLSELGQEGQDKFRVHGRYPGHDLLHGVVSEACTLDEGE